MPERSAKRVRSYAILFSFVLALAVRGAFVALRPSEGGDWILYRNVAENILRGCGVAVTIPGVGDCVAHFGGNQLPLYPAFAAAIWAVSGHSNLAIMMAQSLVAAVSIAYCTYAVGRSTGSRTAMALAGPILAVSPLTVVFAGKLLTETLALAAVQWTLAEMLLSLHDRRVRVVPLAAAIAASAWVRMDGVLLLGLLPILAWPIAARGSGQVVRAAIPCLAVTGIVAASCLAWSARNVSVGLPVLPRPWVKTDGTYWAQGYTRWVTTWAVGQVERGDALYYDLRDPRYELSPAAFRSPQERADVLRWVAEVRATPGTTIPAHVDARFAALARDREAAMTAGDKLARFGGRLRAVSGRWFWPWAHGVGDGRNWNTASDLYRFGLVVTALMALLWGSRRRNLVLAVPAGAALAYLVLRAVFFAATANTELRYMVEVAPLFEMTAALVGAAVAVAVAQRAVVANGAIGPTDGRHDRPDCRPPGLSR